ncbi:hypothetical protein EDF66_105347 [Sphingobacterium sp. JUb20]|nr:hypothetical protein [Sphingobacterium sp. JUb21]TCR07714.1 hypothetical protein EDF66_105347 [Sphingobacterium sp. JUb20]
MILFYFSHSKKCNAFCCNCKSISNNDIYIKSNVRNHQKDCAEDLLIFSLKDNKMRYEQTKFAKFYRDNNTITLIRENVPMLSGYNFDEISYNVHFFDFKEHNSIF